MAVVDEFKQFMSTHLKANVKPHLKLSVATIQFYNGLHFVYKGSLENVGEKNSVIYYQSVFNLLQSCAKVLRISSNSFRSCTLANESLEQFFLPYNQQIPVTDHDFKFVFRVLKPDNVTDMLHSDPETFNYIYLQSKSDLLRIMSSQDAPSNYAPWLISSLSLLILVTLRKLNLPLTDVYLGRCIKMFEHHNPSFIKENSSQIMKSVRSTVKKDLPVHELQMMFVDKVGDVVCLSVRSHNISVKITHPVEESYPEATMKMSRECIELAWRKAFIKNILYTDIAIVRYIKKRSFEFVLLDQCVIEVTMQGNDLQSCLTFLDFFYRQHTPHKVVLEPSSSFDPYAVSYNEVNQTQSASNNYNLLTQSPLLEKQLSVRNGTLILRQLGYRVGWYIFAKMQNPSYVPMCIVLNSSKVHVIKIKTGHGLFWVEEKGKSKTEYRSLDDLVSQIIILDSKEKLPVKPTQIVTEEIIIDKRRPVLEFDNEIHKLSHHLSIHSISLVPSTGDAGPLYATLQGRWLDPEGDFHSVRCFRYSYRSCQDEVARALTRLGELSRLEYAHENILRCHGVALNSTSVFVVYEQFGHRFGDTFVRNYSHEQLWDFGNQIKSALLFLHDRDITHGFPALCNVYIDPSYTTVKLGKVGFLSSLILTAKPHHTGGFHSPSTLDTYLGGWFSAKRIKMLHECPEEKLQETWDR
eukprot:sb/3462635/